MNLYGEILIDATDIILVKKKSNIPREKEREEEVRKEWVPGAIFHSTAFRSRT